MPRDKPPRTISASAQPRRRRQSQRRAPKSPSALSKSIFLDIARAGFRQCEALPSAPAAARSRGPPE
eukprot:1026093-Pyramimonas_sp.AAC.1